MSKYIRNALLFLIFFLILLYLVKSANPWLLVCDQLAQKLTGLLLNPTSFALIKVLTNLASYQATSVLGFVLAGVIWFKTGFVNASTCIVLLGILNFICGQSKPLIQRARPANKLVEIGGFSFPSGHTFAAVSLAILACYFLFSHFKHRYLKQTCYLLAGGFVLFIAFSRVFLRVHYFSDTLASVLLFGFLWNLFLAIRLFIAQSYNRV